jgi:formate hydrogenlyase transcriptional activator
VGLASFSFPYPQEADPQFPDEPGIDLGETPLRWQLDREGRPVRAQAAQPAGVTIPMPPNREAGYVRLNEDTALCQSFEGMVGQSPVLLKVIRLIETVAPGDSTVLLLGETGTGKELVARALHNRSRRRERNLVKLNCAAIPTGLLESELFGHERGAFTGAISQKIGRLETADRGSLFLDEIGDIPLELQPKLLRALQEREFERLGSTRTQRVDVRIIAATHRNLEEMILEKLFRSDLYYRLNVFPIRIPPLRERPEDIPQLVRHFVRQAACKMNKAIDVVPREIMDALSEYPWPGNIRELENVIERAVILSPGEVLRVPVRDLRAHLAPNLNCKRSQTLEDVERRHILSTLRETRWVVSGRRGAAARLGLNRATLYFRMKKLGIVRPGAESDLRGVRSGTGGFGQPEYYGGEMP